MGRGSADGLGRPHQGTHLSEFVEGAVVLANVVLLQVGDGFAVVHASEGTLGRLEILTHNHRTKRYAQ